MNTTNTVKNKIMRRVYYSYALSIATSAALWQGFLLGACISLFGRLTHVAAIVRNLEATRIGDAPQFVFNSFMNAFVHGEVLTVLVTFLIVGLSVSFARQFVGAVQSLRIVRFV